eukprot:6178194-Pleurochrysis_carterae.AAC.1
MPCLLSDVPACFFLVCCQVAPSGTSKLPQWQQDVLARAQWQVACPTTEHARMLALFSGVNFGCRLPRL